MSLEVAIPMVDGYFSLVHCQFVALAHQKNWDSRPELLQQEDSGFPRYHLRLDFPAIGVDHQADVAIRTGNPEVVASPLRSVQIAYLITVKMYFKYLPCFSRHSEQRKTANIICCINVLSEPNKAKAT